MNCRELARVLLKTPNENVFVCERVLDENGKQIDSSYYEIVVEPWDPAFPDENIIIYVNPDELVSG